MTAHSDAPALLLMLGLGLAGLALYHLARHAPGGAAASTARPAAARDGLPTSHAWLILKPGQ